MSINYPITTVNGLNVNHVPVSDRGLAYGDGLFETMLIVREDIPLWPLHHERLLKGLVRLQIAVESQRIRHVIDTALEAAKDVPADLLILKLIVTRGESSRGYQVDSSVHSTLITQLSPLVLDVNKHEGVHVHCCEHVLMPIAWAGLKTLNQLPYVLAAQERSHTHFDEGLLFTAEGELIEATARNIFIVKDDKIVTPIIDQCGVAGVMRQNIANKIAVQIGVEVIEQRLYKEDLFSADEVFLANSISGIWPVIECEKQRWLIGPITRSLQAMCHGVFIGNT